MSDLDVAYQGVLVERSADVLPDKTVQDAVEIARHYRRLQTELASLQQDLEHERLRLAQMEAARAAAHSAHTEFLGLLGSMEHNGIPAMVGAMAAYQKASDVVVREWTESASRRCQELQKKEHSIDTRLCEIRAMLAAGAKEIIDPLKADKKLCPICFDKEVAVACVPCGHTICADCCSKTTTTRLCHSCRGRVNQHIKIFFSV